MGRPTPCMACLVSSTKDFNACRYDMQCGDSCITCLDKHLICVLPADEHLIYALPSGPAIEEILARQTYSIQGLISDLSEVTQAKTAWSLCAQLLGSHLLLEEQSTQIPPPFAYYKAAVLVMSEHPDLMSLVMSVLRRTVFLLRAQGHDEEAKELGKMIDGKKRKRDTDMMETEHGKRKTGLMDTEHGKMDTDEMGADEMDAGVRDADQMDTKKGKGDATRKETGKGKWRRLS